MPHRHLRNHVRRQVSADGLDGVDYSFAAGPSAQVGATLAAAQTLFNRQAIGSEDVPVRGTLERLGLEIASEVFEQS